MGLRGACTLFQRTARHQTMLEDRPVRLRHTELPRPSSTMRGGLLEPRSTSTVVSNSHTRALSKNRVVWAGFPNSRPGTSLESQEGRVYGSQTRTGTGVGLPAHVRFREQQTVADRIDRRIWGVALPVRLGQQRWTSAAPTGRFGWTAAHPARGRPPRRKLKHKGDAECVYHT